MSSKSSPAVTAGTMRVLFGFLTDQMSDQEEALNEALDAHLLHKDIAFYRAITEAKQNRACVARVLTLLSQGRYEDALREFGLADGSKE